MRFYRLIPGLNDPRVIIYIYIHIYTPTRYFRLTTEYIRLQFDQSLIYVLYIYIYTRIYDSK